jgi:hypothetical protein
VLSASPILLLAPSSSWLPRLRFSEFILPVLVLVVSFGTAGTLFALPFPFADDAAGVDTFAAPSSSALKLSSLI